MSDDSSAEVFVYMGGDMVLPDDVVRVRVHPSVTVIPERAFKERFQLEEIELCDGLLEIGEFTFESCKSLRHIKIPSTVTTISWCSFSNCEKLETIQLNEGLQDIGDYAFFQCKSLKAATIPSTVRTIGESALYKTKLSHINLPDGIESIGGRAFRYSKLLNFRMPQSITTISGGLFDTCESLFSVELSESTTQIGGVAFDLCHSLRNIALPISAEIGDSALRYCTDLLQLFGTQQQIINALKHRFDTLPIHKMIYYQSYNNLTSDQLSEATDLRYGQRRSLRRKVNPTGTEQDCLGMTPLHILACSTVQNTELYRVLIDKYPENLITEDGWGAVPLLYAIWGNAPNEIIQFLVESDQSLYPDYELNWSSMVETLGKANATTKVIQNLLDVQQEFFPEQFVDWSSVLAVCSESNRGWNQPECSEETFRFLVKCSVSKRINAIGLKQLRDSVTHDINTVRPSDGIYGNFDKGAYLTTIRSKLTEYEAEYYQLKDATTILELALWKKRVDEYRQSESRCIKRIRIEQSDLRGQCRISCGANIVIQHVLPYLLPGSAVIQ